VAAAIEAFKRGDEVLGKFSGSPIMTVLAVDGLKVRCRDGQDLQYWFDTMMLERYERPDEASVTTAEGEPPAPRDELTRLSAETALN
jgi:hypothetical protein